MVSRSVDTSNGPTMPGIFQKFLVEDSLRISDNSPIDTVTNTNEDEGGKVLVFHDQMIDGLITIGETYGVVQGPKG